MWAHRLLDVLAKEKLRGIFANRPATVTDYACCMDPE